jgi:aminoglycoside phosphotransferase (APT) family kinase protein
MSGEDALRAALAAWLDERHPGAALGRSWPLKGGVSARMTAFETADGAHRYVLRQPGEGADSPADVRREHRLLGWLDGCGASVPEPIELDLFGARFGRPGLIQSFIEGAPVYEPAEPIEFAEAMAAGLHHVHRRGQVHGGLDFLPDATLRAERALACAEQAALPGSDEAHWAAVLRRRFPIESRNPPTLLHGDYWTGNVLWDGAAIAAIVDWEEAGWGDPLADLAIARLDILWLSGEAALEAFTDHYAGLFEVDLTRLPEWDLWAALRPNGFIDHWAQSWPDAGRPDITPNSMRAGIRHLAEHALAALR